MIKTHRPRGLLWSCASPFQKSRGYREITVEDIHVPAYCEVLVVDPEARLPSPERAAKRQRIEQLADDFISGVDLEILSAQVPRQLVSPESSNDGPVWQDVQSDQEFFRYHNRQARLSLTGANGCRTEITEWTSASASCRAHTSPRERVSCVAFEPDTMLPLPIATTASTDISSSRPSSAVCAAPVPTAAWTSSKWLNTGAFVPRSKRVNEDCSIDELGVSSALSAIGHAPILPLRCTTTLAVSHDAKAFLRFANKVKPFLGLRTHQDLFSSSDVLNGPCNQYWTPTASLSTAHKSSAVEPHVTASSTHLTADIASEPSPHHLLRTLTRRRSAPAMSQTFRAEIAKAGDYRLHLPSPSKIQYEASCSNGASPFIFRKRTSTHVETSIALSDQGRNNNNRTEPPGHTRRDECTHDSLMRAHNDTPGLSEHLKDSRSVESQPSGQAHESQSVISQRSNSERNHQPENLPLDSPGGANAVLDPQSVSPPNQPHCWPGTQAMLMEAQRGLFDSPSDQKSLGALVNPRAFANRNNTNGGLRKAPRSATRRPRLPLSQGNTPSTQALLDGWHGWSTVKKPRHNSHKSDCFESPTLNKHYTASDPVDLSEAQTRARESLGHASHLSSPTPRERHLGLGRLNETQTVNMAIGCDTDGKSAEPLSLRVQSVVKATSAFPREDVRGPSGYGRASRLSTGIIDEDRSTMNPSTLSF